MSKIAAYIALAIMTAIIAIILAATFAGLVILAPVMLLTPRLLKRAPKPEPFRPTDEDLHAWIEGRRD